MQQLGRPDRRRSRCRGRSHRHGVQEGGRRGTGEALSAEGHCRGPPAPDPVACCPSTSRRWRAFNRPLPTTAFAFSPRTARTSGKPRDKVRKLRESLNAEAIGVLRQARQATDQVWQRLDRSQPRRRELEATVEKLKGALGLASRSWIVGRDRRQHQDGAGRLSQCLLRIVRPAAESPTSRPSVRSRTAPSGNRWRANNSSMAATLLSPLQGRVGTDDDKESVTSGTSLGKASLTEMESDLAAVDGLKSSVLVKLQELSIGGEKKAPDPKGSSVRVLQSSHPDASGTRQGPRPHPGFASEVHR